MFGKITLLTVFVAAAGVFAVLSPGGETEAVVHAEKLLVAGAIDASTVSADSFLIFDLATGLPLASQDPDTPRPIASVTKLFSAASVLEEAQLSATTTITWGDVNAEGDAGKLKPFTEYSYRDLLWPLLLESSNDAAAALERVEPDLVVKMNNYATQRGAPNTHFSDASGLSAQNISTAKELAVLVRDLYVRQPHVFDITQLPQYVGTQTGWVNNNPFVKAPEYRGGKHGFTYEANRTGTVIFEETLGTGENRLIGYVVLGSDNLASDIEVLREQVQQQVGLQ